MNFDNVVENKIREAMEAGLFDNLAGKGQPLRLEDNPHEPIAWQLAHSMLKDNGFTLPWIEERKEIEEAIEAALKSLAGTYRDTHRSKQPDVWARAEWRRATDRFTEAIGKLNKRIRDYNLTVPALIFQRALLDPEKDIARVASEAVTGAMWDASQ